MPQNKRKEKNKISLKHNRLNYGALSHPLLKGSFTVEASLVLPLFLFAMIAVLFLFRVLQLQYLVENSLDKAAASTAVLGEQQPWEVELRLKAEFYKHLKDQSCPFSYLVMGIAGFSWEGSVTDKEYLDIKVACRAAVPSVLFQQKTIRIASRVKIRRWNGALLSEGNGPFGTWVYITPNGTVYHRNRACTYLKLSVSYVPWTSIKGSNYRACSYCAKGMTIPSMVYITGEGEHYHTRIDCSGLKRTIYMIRIEQAQGKTPCSRCGGV